MRAAPEIHLSEAHAGACYGDMPFTQSLAKPGNIFKSRSTAQKGG